MANHKSALKRARQNELRRLRNKAAKSKIKSAVKGFKSAVGEGSSVETAAAKLVEAKSVIAKAANKGVIHKRNASRKISRLTKMINAMNG